MEDISPGFNIYILHSMIAYSKKDKKKKKKNIQNLDKSLDYGFSSYRYVQWKYNINLFTVRATFLSSVVHK